MVEYYEDPYPEPYIAELSWSPVQSADLYVVQYKDMDDEFTSFGLQEIMFVQRPDAIFKKPRLCPTYGFRIAAVNRFGVSNFSDVERIDHFLPQFRKLRMHAGFLALIPTDRWVHLIKVQLEHHLYVAKRPT
ncbi:hypothetical protein D918_09298 [Trichuris suis]|nr:hypothetical protein D918_09298 [Trichuris suis]